VNRAAVHTIGASLAMGTLAACDAGPRDEAERPSEYGIRYLGDPILATNCARLEGPKDYNAHLVEAMQRVMSEWRHGYPPGVGISAPQVGAAVQVILTPVAGVTTVMLNPRIINRSEDQAYGTEGCLSIPGFYTSVKRHRWVAVEWEDAQWTTHFARIDGPGAMPHFEARVVQHEIDHLHGKQIIDGLQRQQRRRAERCVAELCA
jgi:peptide deformylase